MDIIGTQIGNLNILSEIGEGGMGVVFLAEHVILGKQFAVKCLSSELSNSPQFKERFEKEAMAQAGLDHPNIVQVNDFFEHNGLYYLVMEYVDGCSLEDMIEDEGKLSENKALPILKDILAGVNFAHSRGIIHRDIKPSNILIDKSGRAKIMDFGIALRAGDNHRLTKTGVDIGTAWYVSPEQVVNPKGVDHRSDVYSIGVVLFEMLTGQTPFDGETDYAVKDKHVREAPPDMKAINPDISDELTGIVMKALEKSPDDRFNGCGEFLEYVEACDRQRDQKDGPGDVNAPEDLEKGEQGPSHEPPEPVFMDPVTGIAFVYVHAGKFMMGRAIEHEDEAEEKAHEVALDGFYIGKYPVTCGQWKSLMGTNPSKCGRGDNYPVEMVSWDNAQDFIEKLTAENDRKYQFRLPTEAEWEYAARSGGEKETYAGGDHIDAVAWYDQNSGNTTHSVGEKAPNGLGLHDMSGNVWEWCQDWFADYPSVAADNPPAPSMGTQRVLRGGSWKSDAMKCRTTCRWCNWPEYKDHSWGFRLVRDMASPEPLAELTIASLPNGASIWIDGRDTGEKTDASIELPVGRYKLGLTLDGFKTATQEVGVDSGTPTELEFRLRKAPVSNAVRKKRRAKVLIAAGVALGMFSFFLVLGLISENAKPQSKNFNPARMASETDNTSEDGIPGNKGAQSNAQRKHLKPRIIGESKLFVKTEPKDSLVRLLNTEKEFHQGMVLKPGNYHVEVSHDGYKTKQGWVTLIAEKDQELQVHLEWIVSRLFVEIEPKDATVRLLNTEKEFHQGMFLKPGHYHVEVSRDGCKTKQGWVTLTAEKSETVQFHLEWVISQLFVEAKPADAHVRLLNIKQEFHQGILLKPGRYHVEVSREGCKTKKTWANLEAGKKETLKIHLIANPLKNSDVSITKKDAAPPVSKTVKDATEEKPRRRFVFNNGAVWDTRTRLEWIVGPDEGTSFSEAKQWLAKKNGHSTRSLWRIPTNNELKTICNKWNPLPAIFKTTGLYVWSYEGADSANVWVFDLENGGLVSHRNISVTVERVFAVRLRKD